MCIGFSRIQFLRALLYGYKEYFNGRGFHIDKNYFNNFQCAASTHSFPNFNGVLTKLSLEYRLDEKLWGCDNVSMPSTNIVLANIC